ncbi:uncharacterized protein BO87DRAFT_417768 [Aspergillus neoniger CBS 115656]|uniref:Uncharacterized protein n=1 Tax=Aspergillus neoniger (strain CBS 115656) TaxID=1448310 RepID=A0A318YHF9_ASPNB|nr:hypothetical protein BO87DRAFT_417768 [Aspergillus neoniger CBS 115656]PYH31963.1 hypothetical protein BO87DRAFT_417768 [Aspergillus neoniger CBS 115656]
MRHEVAGLLGNLNVIYGHWQLVDFRSETTTIKMPHTKTDTAFRYPQNEDQSRRLRNTTQDQRAAQRQQYSSESATAASLAADPTSNWGPEEFFETTVDEYGQPVTDQ